MKMIVEEREFIEALKQHFKDKIVIKPSQTFNISYKAGRKGNGLTVFLEIIENSSITVETDKTVHSTNLIELKEKLGEEKYFTLNENSSLFSTQDQTEEEIDEELEELDEEESSDTPNLFGN
jgi:hypothetical protein